MGLELFAECLKIISKWMNVTFPAFRFLSWTENAERNLLERISKIIQLRPDFMPRSTNDPSDLLWLKLYHKNNILTKTVWNVSILNLKPNFSRAMCVCVFMCTPALPCFNGIFSFGLHVECFQGRTQLKVFATEPLQHISSPGGDCFFQVTRTSCRNFFGGETFLSLNVKSVNVRFN